MCRAKGAFAAGLILAIVGVMSLSVWAEEQDPVAAKAVDAATLKVEDAKAEPAEPAGESPATDARSWGVPIIPPTAAELRIERALKQKASLKVEDAELGQVLTLMRRQYGIEIRVDRETLEEYDLGVDTPVTCAVSNVSLRSALRLMLRDLDLTFIIRDEVLLVTSDEVAEEYRTTRVYDVADLVTYRDEKGQRWTCYDPLVDVLTTSIEVETWMELGGGGTIEGCDISTAKMLIITQTEDVHRQIAGALTTIRRVVAQSPGDGQPPLRPREPQKSARGASGPMPGGMMGGMGSLHGGSSTPQGQARADRATTAASGNPGPAPDSETLNLVIGGGETLKSSGDPNKFSGDANKRNVGMF